MSTTGTARSKSGQHQQSIKSFLSGRRSSSNSTSGNNIGDSNKKPVATVRPVSIIHHDNMNPSIDLTKSPSPIFSRSKFTLNR